jgi:hypothetical protein
MTGQQIATSALLRRGKQKVALMGWDSIGILLVGAAKGK